MQHCVGGQEKVSIHSSLNPVWGWGAGPPLGAGASPCSPPSEGPERTTSAGLSLAYENQMKSEPNEGLV